MPKLSKQFHLEITVEQFLNACSYLELQELDLQIGTYLKKAQADHDRQERLTHKVKEEFAAGFIKDLDHIEKTFDLEEDF